MGCPCKNKNKTVGNTTTKPSAPSKNGNIPGSRIVRREIK
jgi:hypothetical protein